MKLSNKYSEKTVETVGTIQYSCTDTISNLFHLNDRNVDKSIVYTMPALSECSLQSNAYTTFYKKDKDQPVLVDGTRAFHSCDITNMKTENSQKYVVIGFPDRTTNGQLYMYSYNEDKTAVYNGIYAGNIKFLRDVPVKNILCDCWNIQAIDVSHTPVNYGRVELITLSDLISNPDKYIIGTFQMSYALWGGTGYTGICKPLIAGMNGSNMFFAEMTALLNEPVFSYNHFNKSLSGGTTFLINFKDNSVYGKMPDAHIDVKDSDFYERTAGTHTFYETEESDTHVLLKTTAYAVQNSAITTMSTQLKPYMRGSYFLKMLASLGLYFVTDHNVAGVTPDNLLQRSNIALGEMNSSFCTTGRFIMGQELLRSKSPNKDGFTVNDEFNPNKASKDDDINDITLNTDRMLSSGMIKYYAMNLSDLNELVTNLNTGQGILDFKNYCDFVVSCDVLPFDISQHYLVAHNAQCKVGDRILGNFDRVENILHNFYLGSYYVQPQHGSFLDYEPYTTVSVHIPYCSDVIIPTNLAMDNEIKIDMIVNVVTGVCRGVVSINNTVYTSTVGNISTPYPLSIESAGSIRAAYVSAITTSVGVMAAGAQGNFVGVGTGLLGVAQSLTAANTITPKVVNGGGDSSTNIMLNDTPVIYMSTPVESLPAGYGHTYGYACNKSDQVGNFSGFTVFANVDTSGLSCDNDSKNRIKALLESGVYI